MQLAFWRALFAGLAMLPFVRRATWTWRILPVAVCFALMNFSFLKAMTLTAAANAIWLQYTAPAWVLLVGVGWLGEKAIRRDYAMVLCAIVGVAVIVFCEWRLGPAQARNRAGVLWSLASGITLAGVMLGLRQVKDLSVVWVTCVCHFSAAAFLSPVVLTQYALPSPALAGWMFLFGAFQFAVPYLFFARGLRTITSHEASCIALLEPLMVPAWVFLCWGTHPEYRPPDWWTALGGAIMLLGLLIRYWPGRMSRPDAAL